MDQGRQAVREEKSNERSTDGRDRPQSTEHSKARRNWSTRLTVSLTLTALCRAFLFWYKRLSKLVIYNNYRLREAIEANRQW